MINLKAYQEERGRSMVDFLKEKFPSQGGRNHDVFAIDGRRERLTTIKTHYLVAGSDKQRMALPQHRALLLYDAPKIRKKNEEKPPLESRRFPREILLVIKRLYVSIKKVPLKRAPS